MSRNNSSLDISCSIFDHNEARQGGAIYQETSKTKLNQCLFMGNSGSAIVGIYNNNISIMNSIFQNNLSKHGGALAIRENSVLNVSHTTFENNTQISTSALNVHQPPNSRTGESGGTILLSKSVANISKASFQNNLASYFCGSIVALPKSLLSINDTVFENNVAGVFGGAICSLESSMNIEYIKFINNSVLEMEFGQGGGLYLVGKSTTKMSNVLLSKCHASGGGAILSSSTTIIMSSSSITDNTGSAIYLSNGDSLEINISTFINNSKPKEGGAILCNACKMNLVNTRFIQNRAMDRGGTVRGYGLSKLIAQNCSFTSNVASQGGAISVDGSDFSISNSNFSQNLATTGGTAFLGYGYLVMRNCRMNNNTALDAGVINARNGTLHMSNCLAFNNTADGTGGVVRSTYCEIVITTSIFKMNRAIESGAVFFVTGGAIILKNSSFLENIATITGGVLVALDQTVGNITQSFCSGNQANHFGAVLHTYSHTNILISDTKISHNSAYQYGALFVNDNSMLELNGSLVEGNTAEFEVGALFILNNSLVVAINSTFKGNSAKAISAICATNSTVYVEKCKFFENRLTYGGTISAGYGGTLKVSDTVFTQNEGYNIEYYVGDKAHSVNKFETHRCLFVRNNISLKSNVKNFAKVAVNEEVIGQYPNLNESFFKPGETPYASSKIFHLLHI